MFEFIVVYIFPKNSIYIINIIIKLRIIEREIKNENKKVLFSLGSASVLVTSSMAVVACGDNTKKYQNDVSVMAQALTGITINRKGALAVNATAKPFTSATLAQLVNGGLGVEKKGAPWNIPSNLEGTTLTYVVNKAAVADGACGKITINIKKGAVTETVTMDVEATS